MRRISPAWAAVAVMAVAVLVAAWMTRFEPVLPYVVWDRWTHDTCTVTKRADGSNLYCVAEHVLGNQFSDPAMSR